MQARLLVPAILSAFCALLTPISGNAKWIYVRSPHFEFYTDGSKGNAQDVLRYLEQTRMIFEKISPGGVESDRPVRIVAFGSESAFKRFRPRESAYAFFARRRDRDYIVFQELDGDRMYEVAVHEYAHLRSAQLGLALPVWLEEGLAELFSTVKPVAKNIRIGAPPQIVRVRGVSSSPKIDEVLTASRFDEKLWKNNDKVVALYARSWALTHLLMLGEDYRDKFPEFLTGIAAGEKGAAMLEEVYGKTAKQVEKDMMAHATASLLPILTYTGEWDKWESNVERRPAEDLEAALVVADLLLVNSKRDESYAAFHEILANHPDSADAHAGLARATREAEEALEHYQKAAALGSADGWLYIDYARTLLTQDDHVVAQARSLLEKARERMPREADPVLALAALSEAAGDADTERSLLGQVQNVEVSQAYPFFLWRVDVMERAGMRPSAKAFLHQARQFVTSLDQMEELRSWEARLGGEPDRRWENAGAALSAGDTAKAVELLNALAEDYPRVAGVFDRLEEAYEAAGDKPRSDAARMLATNRRRVHAIQARKDDSDVFRRIWLLDATGAYERSQTFHDALMALEPKGWVLANNRAWDLAEKGQLLDRALILAEKGVALSDERASCLDTLGWVQLKLGRFDDAIATFDKVLAKEPKSYLYHYHSGVVYLEKGDKAKARTLFEAALGLKPTEYWRKKIQESLD